MSKLLPEQHQLLRLIDRSPERDGGWRKVSATLRGSVEKWSTGLERLVEKKVVDDVLFVSLTTSGQAIVDFT